MGMRKTNQHWPDVALHASGVPNLPICETHCESDSEAKAELSNTGFKAKAEF